MHLSCLLSTHIKRWSCYSSTKFATTVNSHIFYFAPYACIICTTCRNCYLLTLIHQTQIPFWQWGIQQYNMKIQYNKTHDTRKSSFWCQALTYTVYKYTINCQSKQGNEIKLDLRSAIKSIIFSLLILLSNLLNITKPLFIYGTIPQALYVLTNKKGLPPVYWMGTRTDFSLSRLLQKQQI